jgi:hypothetical protein
MKAISGPTYLVQLPSGHIYGYWKKEDLLHDIRLNKEDGKVKVFEISQDSFVLKYNPINIETESLSPHLDRAYLEKDKSEKDKLDKWIKRVEKKAKNE